MRTNVRALGWSIRAAAGFIGVGLALSNTPVIRAQVVPPPPSVAGQWATLGTLMPINPVHTALMNNGKVLIVSGSGNVAAETNFRSAVLDLQTYNITVTNSMPWDMFCNGMVVLADGRVFVNGGNYKYDPFFGERRNAVFDPATGLFTDVQPMAHGRWYPTTTMLGDGRVMTFSGLDENSNTNSTVEIYTVGSGWSQAYSAGWTPPLYPRMHLLPDGRVLYSGSGTGSRIFDPSALTWSPGVVANTNSSTTRTYGTSVLLPLRASEGYKARVMIFGGGNPSIATTEILNTYETPLQWRPGPPMSQPRIEMNATILPNGKVLATGGSGSDEVASTASLNADLYDPVTNTFSSAGANAYARLYHSNALLLPDATVLLLGGNPSRGTYEQRMEIYSPAYLFDTNNNLLPPEARPSITGVTPGTLTYGAPFQIQTPNAADISSVVLIRPGAPTHAFDMEQRLLELPYSLVGGALTATAPPNGNTAPPGYYMLFILNSAGVPSVATFVRLAPASPNQAPTASIDSPTAAPTVNPGGSVTFLGSGSDSDGQIEAYAWTFPGGSPPSGSVAAPGSVTYQTPGSYTATLRVTDNGGLTSLPATRTVTVSDFSLSASPSSRTVAPGSGAVYTTTVTTGSGFTGTVDFTVTGLPSGATWSFGPTSVVGPQSTTLNVSIPVGTLAGTYSLTIRGTSGPVTHTVGATLIVPVVGDFSIGPPTSQTVSNGNNATYTVNITPTPMSGFNGTVSLTLGALPKFVTGSFNPASLSQLGGPSVLTLATKKQTKAGSYTVTVTGTSGTLVHSVNLTLVVQ